MAKDSVPSRRSGVTSGALTALSIATVNGSAAVVGILLGRDYGHGARTAGFFAAYTIYIVLVLAATAFRVVVLPRLARAEQVGRLGAETAAYALALAVLAVPALLMSSLAADQVSGLLTSGPVARRAAASVLVWLVPAAVGQLYAGLLASALAALNDYVTPAVGFSAASLAGLGLIVALIGHGVVVLGWGLALNGAVSVAVPLVSLARRGALARIGGLELRLRARLRELGEGVALPLVLQGLYLVAFAFAKTLGNGPQTTLSYAYLIASFLVGVTASSISLISSVPLTRQGLVDDRAAVHVVSTAWLSLTLVAGAAGVFALAGEEVVHAVLGASYAGGTGAELGRLVAYLSPWMVASIGVSVTFPLLFVAGRTRLLPALALGALAVHVPIEYGFRALFGLPGIVGGLALTTLLVLCALLATLSPRTLAGVARGLGWPTFVNGGLAGLSFAVLAVFLPPIPAAAVGVLVYAGLLAVLRPPGLRRAWSYVRALG